MDCFDSDVLIYAAQPQHRLGRRVRMLLDRTDVDTRAGSVLLLPELLSKPTRDGQTMELGVLKDLLGRLELHPVDRPLAQLATSLGSRYTLRAADAVHLATAVVLGADRFITNNRRDFDVGVAEVAVVFAEELPEPG